MFCPHVVGPGIRIHSIKARRSNSRCVTVEILQAADSTDSNHNAVARLDLLVQKIQVQA